MGNISRISIECFEFIMLALNINIRHGYNHKYGEYCIPSSSPVDGKFDGPIAQLTNKIQNLFTIKHIVPNSLKTIIEYNGYWTHGDERTDKPDKLIIHRRKCKDQWTHDNKKYNKYYQAGYNVIVIYEKDYKEIRKTDIFKQYREKINEKLLQYDFSKSIPAPDHSLRMKKKYEQTEERIKLSAAQSPKFARNIQVADDGFICAFSFRVNGKRKVLTYSFKNKTLTLKKRSVIIRMIIDIVDIMRENHGNYEKIKEVCDKIYKNEYLNKNTLNSGGRGRNGGKGRFKSIHRVINKIQKMDNGCGYKIKRRAHNISFQKKYFFKDKGRVTKNNKQYKHLFCQSEEECKQRLIQHIWLKYIWRHYHPN